MTDYIEHIGYVEKKFPGSWSGMYGYGYYAFVKEGLLYIGEERHREGGNLYVGKYKGEDTPFLKSVKEENEKLYNSIIEYYMTEGN